MCCQPRHKPAAKRITASPLNGHVSQGRSSSQCLSLWSSVGCAVAAAAGPATAAVPAQLAGPGLQRRGDEMRRVVVCISLQPTLTMEQSLW